MALIPAKTPGFVKTLFPNFIWNIDTDNSEIYLTFDDGPTPKITRWVLEQLKHYNAKATFFCIGKNIENYPDIFRDILFDGHNVGNHTFNHLKGWKYKTKHYLTDVSQCQQLMHSSTKLFRPPYGKFKSKQAKKLQQLGYKIIMWDVLSFDWDSNVTQQQCLKNVTSSVKKGSIVVFHDSEKAFGNLKYVLPSVLEYYTNKGFEFKALY
ncbi:MAG: polysaccharide deacetylase family protein [Winogradskyella sp.]|uniref:polysaccharide deacetylase family protein n=1 Tax=Winogradskyella sp. TaxID=1883156 RepID=UPI000F3F12DA|nr:polysaccharide deacetylase family protein [Winogradskyella sp.]RNC88435.1 MAG: polysaccharide deacetylase family protein [Winogradskyella sp.]